jgi:hypothetical protein
MIRVPVSVVTIKILLLYHYFLPSRPIAPSTWDQGRTLGVCVCGGGGGCDTPQLFKIGRKSVQKNAYQITSSVPEHPIY